MHHKACKIFCMFLVIVFTFTMILLGLSFAATKTSTTSGSNAGGGKYTTTVTQMQSDRNLSETGKMYGNVNGGSAAGTLGQLSSTGVMTERSDIIETTNTSLADGAGFLAIDKNLDGKITCGNELFGPKTDDGFKELAIYDSNLDNVIDTDDLVYEKLVVWSKDSANSYILKPLSDYGIKEIKLAEITYFDEGKINIIANDDYLGYVLSRSSFAKYGGNTGIVEDLMLKIE